MPERLRENVEILRGDYWNIRDCENYAKTFTTPRRWNANERQQAPLIPAQKVRLINQLDIVQVSRTLRRDEIIWSEWSESSEASSFLDCSQSVSSINSANDGPKAGLRSWVSMSFLEVLFTSCHLR